MGKEVFVPVTMKVEPSELATIEMIAKASKRSRSDVMREMVTLGMQQMLECAFAPKGEGESGKAGSAGANDADAPGSEDVAPDDARAQGHAVEALLPLAKDGTATRGQWAELAWRSAAILCLAATGEAGDTPEGALQALSVLAQERGDTEGPLQAELGLSEDDVAALGRASRLVLKSGLLEGEAFSVDAEAAVRDAVMAITDAAVGSKTSETRTNEGVDGVPEPEAPGDPKLARALAQKGAREIVDYVSRHPRANTSELLAATGFSSSTLRRRIVALQKADAIFNDGTATRPVWRVPGVEHGPEEMLTATQAAVLGLMRREPPTPTGQISSELGLTKTAVTLAYRELADLGLAFKDGGRWRATSQKDAEGVADA
jgi:DNA-binding Lrp family transcriptional regulator